MADRINIEQNADHVGGKFKWEREPSCCDRLKLAVDDDRFIFVSNFVDGAEGSNTFYMMPVDSEGYLVRSKGVVIEHCPWCGSKIDGRKRYPRK
ncbi:MULTISPECIES: hypothetical protein [unclassified Sphingomonas]|uniref:hypothetical protein n=1 Tax=unclassified Sphingomonas TaxID=196159 RepID=UPI0009EB0EA8|nr:MULTISPECIES: hypothetical protein [unclassified Sphingomonas]